MRGGEGGHYLSPYMTTCVNTCKTRVRCSNNESSRYKGFLGEAPINFGIIVIRELSSRCELLVVRSRTVVSCRIIVSC